MKKFKIENDVKFVYEIKKLKRIRKNLIIHV